MEFIFLALGLLSFLYANYSHKQFIELLKENHSSLYEEMGSPTMFTRYPLATVQMIWASNEFMRYATFMANKEWLSLKDKELVKCASRRRLFNIGFIVFVLLFMALFTKNA
jgi:hypothetical protein